jgi:polysaccharide export outer membrane protein
MYVLRLPRALRRPLGRPLGRSLGRSLGAIGALLLLVAAIGCARLRPPPFDYSREPDPNKTDYVLGPGDIVDVRQWKNPDVSGRLRVLPDGTIAVPLLGQVTAAGLTVRELRDKLSRGLEKYIAQNAEMPTLTVAVDEFQSYSVSVLGEVNQPGHYQPGHYVTVLEAIALAHGLTPYARGEQIVILRRSSGGKARRIPISYPLLAAGRRPEMNLFLLRGDVVVVP